MKKIILIAIIGLLAGCEKDPISTEQKGNFQVEKLFDYKGCEMGRFSDGGRKRYFMVCDHEARVMQENTVHSGKTTSTYYDDIPTRY